MIESCCGSMARGGIGAAAGDQQAYWLTED